MVWCHVDLTLARLVTDNCVLRFDELAQSEDPKVTPRGKNAEKAGLKPGEPVSVKEIRTFRFGGAARPGVGLIGGLIGGLFGLDYDPIEASLRWIGNNQYDFHNRIFE